MRLSRSFPLSLHIEGDRPRANIAIWLGPWVALSAMVVVFAAEFSWLSIMRHLSYQSHGFDLGNMDQAVWNTLHGNLLRITSMVVHNHVLTTRFAIHVEPLLVAFAPLYLLHSGPETLLLAQACIVSTGAIPAYLLARRWLARPWLSLAFPAAYLLHPSLQNAVLDDFHAVTLSACFLLWALYFTFSGAMTCFAVSAVLAMATKEEVGLFVALLGIILLIRGHRYAGFMAVVCGIGWTLAAFLLIIPAANPSGQSPYLARYNYLGHGLGGLLLSPIRHPHLVWQTLTSTSRLDYLLALLHPLGFVSILAFPLVLLALPALAINMLSADPTMFSGLYQYSADVVPYVVVAATAGTALAVRHAQHWNIRGQRFVPVVLCCFVALASIVDTRRLGFSPLADGYIIPSRGLHQDVEDRILARIPTNTVVAASEEILPHVSERYWLYRLPTTYPDNGPQAQEIVLDASVPSFPIRPSTLRAVVSRALKSGYGVERAEDGILLLRKGARSHTFPPSFFSFFFRGVDVSATPFARWGQLQLSSVHALPVSGLLTPSRPDIILDTTWVASKRLKKGIRITFYLSPVYQGNHPAFSSLWTQERDSATWDWLPIDVWPVRRPIRVMSVPLLPKIYEQGKVDVAIGVQGSGVRSRAIAGQQVKQAPQLVRVATFDVGP